MHRALTLIVALTPAAAVAHPGGHNEFVSSEAMIHALSAPDHLLPMIAVVVVSVLGGIVWRRQIARQGVRR